MNLDKSVCLRFDRDFLRSIKRAAKRSDLSVSAWIRMILWDSLRYGGQAK